MPRGSGRRPKPTALKKLQGNPGKRKLNQDEPQPAQGIPEMPEGLGEIAQAEWRAIVPALEAMGVLTLVDGKALAAYCSAFEDWVESRKDIKKYGRVIESPAFVTKEGEAIGIVVRGNPAVGQRERAAKQMKSFLIEFGMTPASRSRIRVDNKSTTADPFDNYMTQAAGKQPIQ